MEKHIIKNGKISRGDITHADQEIEGLQFSCFHLANGNVIITVNGDETNIDEWTSRFGTDVSEMSVSEYNKVTEEDIKAALESDIEELGKELKEKKGQMTR